MYASIFRFLCARTDYLSCMSPTSVAKVGGGGELGGIAPTCMSPTRVARGARGNRPNKYVIYQHIKNGKRQQISARSLRSLAII